MSRSQSHMLKWFIIIMVFILATQGGYAGFRIMGTYPAYTTGYQGAHARFYGVKYDKKAHTQGLWDTTFRWDNPQHQGESWEDGNTPPIAGEMTSVFVPSESIGYQPNWINPDWLLEASKQKNPVDTYEWKIEGGENEIEFYRMELWRLKWYFSISSEPKDDKDIPQYSGVLSRPRNSLEDCEVWFEFDLTPIWYFNGTDAAYFAIASIRISDIELGGVHGDDRVDHDSRLRVTPSSEQSILPIYYTGFGESRAEKTIHTYKGKTLNPDLFVDRVYSYITLNDFGVSCWWDWGWFWKADTITIGLDVDVFVIGEWKVQDIQELPDEYGREAKAGGEGLGLGAALSAFLGSSEGRLWLLIAVGAVVFLILAIFAPWVLISLSHLFGVRRRT